VKARLYVAAALILAGGLSAGAVLYIVGDDAEEPAGSYLITNGVAYPVAAQSSKAYVRDLRRFGGRAAVLFDEFNEWLAGRWRGKTLGLTMIEISVLLAAALFLIGVRS